MNQNERKQRKHLPLSAYFSYLLVATLLLTGVTFSKYSTEVTSRDNARVAKVAIDHTGTSGSTITIDKPNNITTASYTFSVKNNDTNGVSEVALSYKVIVTLPKALPTGVDIALKNSSNTSFGRSWNDAKTIYTFTSPVNFPAGMSTTHNLTLLFTGGTSLTTTDTLNGISVSVTAEQID